MEGTECVLVEDGEGTPRFVWPAAGKRKSPTLRQRRSGDRGAAGAREMAGLWVYVYET